MVRNGDNNINIIMITITTRLLIDCINLSISRTHNYSVNKVLYNKNYSMQERKAKKNNDPADNKMRGHNIIVC